MRKGMKTMRACLFCGKRVADPDDEIFGVTYCKKIGKWVFSHWCNATNPTDDAFITVYGETKQDVIDKWNGVYEK